MNGQNGSRGEGENIGLKLETGEAESMGRDCECENKRKRADGKPKVGQRYPQSSGGGACAEPTDDAQRECFEIVFGDLRPAARIDFGVNPIERCCECQGCGERRVMGWIGVGEPEEQKRNRIVKSEYSAGDNADKQAEPAEDRLTETQAGDGENLRLHQPQHRPTDTMKLERHRGDKQNSSNGGEHYKRLPPTRTDTESQRHFNCAQRHQRPERPLGMRGLIFEKAEHADRIQHGGKAGDILLVLIERRADDIGCAEDEPVEQDERGGWPELSEGRVVFGQHLGEPGQVAEIDGNQASEFQPGPMALRGDNDKRHGEHDAGREAKDHRAVSRFEMAGEQCDEAEHERQTGHGLGPVAERMSHHAGGDKQHEDEIGGQRLEHARGRDVVHGVGGEEGQRPAASDSATSKNAVGGLAFEPHASCQECKAYCKAAEDLAARSPGLELNGKKESNSNHQTCDTQLVEPIGAELLLQGKNGFARGCFSFCTGRRRGGGWWLGRFGSRLWNEGCLRRRGWCRNPWS